MTAETYELRVSFQENDPVTIVKTKDDIKNWLIGMGEESFVEGAVDDLPADTLPPSSSFETLGGDKTPISIYSFDFEYLTNLRQELERIFAARIQCAILTIDSQIWQKGWTESFSSITTDRFHIHPPWSPPAAGGKIALNINPGVAFGDGHHETTQLCLNALESLKPFLDLESAKLLDVGTGTGILAIAAKKLGFAAVMATDIDADSMLSAKNNAAANDVTIEFFLSSFPPQKKLFDVVVANIFGVVLKGMAADLAARVAPGGWLLLSGLQDAELEDMMSCFSPLGFDLQTHHLLHGWMVMCLRKADWRTS